MVPPSETLHLHDQKAFLTTTAPFGLHRSCHQCLTTSPTLMTGQEQHFDFRYVDLLGTVGVALAGLLGTVRAQGRPLSDFANQKIVVVGAGSFQIRGIVLGKQLLKDSSTSSPDEC
ncbi:hypothetical protein L2E82_40736 [Cichorium intybus]|uniref:Uncharacterized protein n=1 Tax=Cichorium intybus TaxID=13427 RepID=A0ACB9AMS2_CICIN|nr:hypothetical protein L2E82_40736 [Cichorium intybus]